MKFIHPNSKVYAFLSLVFQILVVHLVFVLGMVSILGFSLANMIVYAFLTKQGILAFCRNLPTRHYLYALASSALSIVIIILATLNFQLLTSYVRFAYLFLYVLILYLLVFANLYSSFLFARTIRLSQIISIGLLNYPKFLCLFSVWTGLAYLLIDTPLVFFFLCTYIGGSVYLLYRSVHPMIKKILEED